ncbi:putative nucleocapsid [Bellinger River virus]|uniref:Putative nucleocapsid n=1 Tax=Bellinger River virus TaxID=2301728 RepID=A0A346I7J1_9NIDO|nr:putative nucleocapsid [Bellinger River virus]AXP11711.1 putative nucleocapsid [Bellinger River virus]
MATFLPMPMQLPLMQPTRPVQRRRRRRPAKRQQRNPNNAMTKKVDMLTKKLDKLMPTVKPDPNVYTFTAKYGEKLAPLLITPEQDSDPRNHMSQEAMTKFANDVSRRLKAGAGTVTIAPTGVVTVHLQFKPIALNPNAQAFVPRDLSEVSEA